MKSTLSTLAALATAATFTAQVAAKHHSPLDPSVFDSQTHVLHAAGLCREYNLHPSSLSSTQGKSTRSLGFEMCQRYCNKRHNVWCQVLAAVHSDGTIENRTDTDPWGREFAIGKCRCQLLDGGKVGRSTTRGGGRTVDTRLHPAMTLATGTVPAGLTTMITTTMTAVAATAETTAVSTGTILIAGETPVGEQQMESGEDDEFET